MKWSFNKTILWAAAVAIGFGSVALLSIAGERVRPQLPDWYEDADLSLQGKRLKGYSLGSEGLLADWYWMWSLQYIGDKIIRSEADINIEDLRPLNPRLLYPMLDNASTLDPQFMAVYSYGASVLPAIDPKQSIALTEKGIEANPNAWRLYQYLGFIHWRLNDYERAAEVYEAGAKIAEAPPFMIQMAAAMRTQGGSRDTARAMYRQMYEEAEDQQSRANAELRLMEIESLDERDMINEVLNAEAKRMGRCPSDLKLIVPKLAGMTHPGGGFRVDRAGSIVDPLGTPYELKAETCTAVLGTDSRIPKPL